MASLRSVPCTEHLGALIVADDRTVLGMDLTVRAAVIARRVGIERIGITGVHRRASGAGAALARRGIAATWMPQIPPGLFPSPITRLIVLPASTIVAPKALAGFLREALASPGRYLIQEAGGERRWCLAALPSSDLEVLSATPDLQDALTRLADAPDSRTALPNGGTCVYLSRGASRSAVRRIERAYLWSVNGGAAEGFFTRLTRRSSIPLTRVLLRLPFAVSANAVTMAALLSSLVAGGFFAAGGYVAGICGAAFYYLSTTLDLSDGEVARATLSESRFGAWLETITDYVSYFVLLAGVVIGDVRREGFCIHARAAIVAALASLAIALIVGYLRARTASADPGAFDDTLASVLHAGTRFQRFAVWGRQLIKRSFVAHLVVFQALIGFLPALTEIWAAGSVVALLVILGVRGHILRHLRVPAISPAMTLVSDT